MLRVPPDWLYWAVSDDTAKSMASQASVGPAASLGRRALALALDWLACLLIIRLAVPDFAYGSSDFGFATLGLFALEATVLTWLTSASFGQRLTGLRVVRVQTGERLALWRSAVRTVLICLVIPAVVIDGEGRGLHDRAVGSICVRVRRSPEMTRPQT